MEGRKDEGVDGPRCLPRPQTLESSINGVSPNRSSKKSNDNSASPTMQPSSSRPLISSPNLKGHVAGVNNHSAGTCFEFPLMPPLYIYIYMYVFDFIFLILLL